MPSARRLQAWVLVLMAVWPGLAWSQTSRPTREDVGAWVLRCPPAVEEPCVLRHRDWLLAPGEGGATTALEVQRRADALVPVVTLRGLATSANLGGALVVTLDVSIGLDNAPPVTLRCGSSGTYFACGPDSAAIPALAGQWLRARVLTIDLSLVVPGLIGVPPQHRVLDMTGAPLAVGRLLAAGQPDGESLPSDDGLDIRGLMDQILRDCGFVHGVSDAVPALLALVLRFTH